MPISKNTKPTVVDLFSGCGGLSLGFERAGFEVLLGVDNWEDALITFKRNHKGSEVLLGDVARLDKDELLGKLHGHKVDVVIGGPPCQGFSISGKRNPNDPRNELYKAFVDVVELLQPEAFLLENVPNLLAMNGGTFKDGIISDFASLGYTVTHKILVASEFGVPQNRRRVMFVGVRGDTEFVFPHGIFGKLHPYVTTKEAIGDLPEGSLDDGSAYPSDPLSNYQKLMRQGSLGVYNHDITVHTEETKRIIDMVPDGGNYKDLPEELHSTRKVNIAWTRMNSAKPSFTIDTGHNHHFHYRYNRVPTARESARLQSFPDNFVFYGNKMSKLKQIGNAVPPIMAQAVADALLAELRSYDGIQPRQPVSLHHN